MLNKNFGFEITGAKKTVEKTLKDKSDCFAIAPENKPEFSIYDGAKKGYYNAF